jgi:CRISPR-associated protein Cas1
MTSLYVDRRGVDMRLDADAIAFFENGERIGTVPTGPLQRIYLRGQVGLTSGLLGRLGQMGIGIIVLSGRRAEPALLMPRAHNDAATRVAQVAAYLEPATRLRIARWIVEGKIRAQGQLAEEWLNARPDARPHTLAARDALRLMTGHPRAKPDLKPIQGLCQEIRPPGPEP